MCVCVCPFVCVPVNISIHQLYRPQFLPALPQIWIVGYTRDNEDQVRWSIKPEVVNAHGRQFTSGLAHF